MWAALAFAIIGQVSAAALDTIGVTALRARHPELTGNDQTVALVEAQQAGGKYQVAPSEVSLPAGVFKYYDTGAPYGGAGAAFNASLVSTHARDVARNMFGLTTGAAPGVDHVENFEAQYFYEGVVRKLTTIGAATYWTPVPIASPIVNQSFIFDTTDAATIAEVSRFYDAYANQFGTLFVNGTKNSASSVTFAPGSMSNGLTVGRVDGAHAGRVHLVAPGGASSYATGYVSGSAVLLRQAAELGHFSAIGGTDPTDARVLKAGLINGATKTVGWTQTETNPLDDTFGAGVLNVDVSHSMLSGGQHVRSAQTQEALGSTPTTMTPSNFLTSPAGWDLASLTASVASDAVAHYFFDLSSSSVITFTATLTWNSLANLALGTNHVSNFDLALVDLDSDTVVWSSHSTSGNVEHLFLTGLASGAYDLQIILRGGLGAPVLTDTYAVVWSSDGIAVVPESGAFYALGILALLAGVAIIRRRPVPR